MKQGVLPYGVEVVEAAGAVGRRRYNAAPTLIDTRTLQA